MKKLLSQLSYEMEETNDVMVVTIVAEAGSAPRGTGAKMLVAKRGLVIGSIGGGAVEKRSEELALEMLAGQRSGIHDFTLHAGGAEDIGMVCGGDVTVLFQYVPGSSELWRSVSAQAANSENAWLITSADGGKAFVWQEGDNAHGAPEEFMRQVPGKKVLYNDGWLAEALPHEDRVIIFGAGHISQALSRMLPALDFKPVVFDCRPQFAAPELFPREAQVICGDFERIADYLTVDKNDYVVIMTSGHAHDYTVQYQIMQGEYAYLGVIGSKNKTATINKRLTEAGIPEHKLGGVHTPIGLSIKAVTPAEIAVSVAAELILVRAQLGTRNETFGGVN